MSCDAAALARVQQEPLHGWSYCPAIDHVIPTLVRGRDPTCCLAMSSSSESEDREAEWEELDA